MSKEIKKPTDEMLEIVICPECEGEEYYGMMHWISGKAICRKCIYERWTNSSKWIPGPSDYVFPLYDDGIDWR